MKLINSTQLHDLIKSNKRKAESIFPELIRRLIRNTCNVDCYTHFPNGDAIYTTGWDGTVKSNKVENRFIPKDNSFWELGTNNNSLAKIKSDYDKRKKMETEFNKFEFAYIAVTAGIIDSVQKEAFVKSITDDAIFKSGFIIDANDIEEWLEDNIDVAIWLLKVFGKDINSYDIAFISDEWQDIIDECTIALNPDIFLVGNEANSKKFISDISDKRDSNIYNISSPFLGNEYAYYFTIATIMQSPDENLQDKFIVVKSKQALDIVTASLCNKIVLANFNCYDFRFLNKGQNDYVFFDSSSPADIELNLPQRGNFIKALEKLDIGKIKAEKLAFLVEYNIIALRRLFSKIPQKRVPFWAKEKEKSDLIPLMLMGELNIEDAGDIDILESIIVCNRDVYVDKLNYWAEIAASPVIKTNSTFRINARKECFSYIKVDVASYRFRQLLKKVEEILLYPLENADGGNWVIPNGTKWSDNRIRDLIDGLIIIGDANKSNQNNIDIFMHDLYEKLLEKEASIVNDFPYFSKMAELSPISFVRFINKLVDDCGDKLNAILKRKRNGFINNVVYITNALDICTSNDYTANEAFDVYVKLFYSVDNINDLTKKIVEMLLPISTMAGLLRIPLRTKIDRFFEIAKDQDKEKTKLVAQALYTDNNGPIMIAHHNSYRIDDEYVEIPLTYQDIFDTRRKVFDWLMENGPTTDAVSLLKIEGACYRNAFSQPVCETRDALSKLLVDINENASEELKGLIYAKAKEQIYLLKLRDDNSYSAFGGLFEKFADDISISDEYFKFRYILTDDRFPVDNLIPKVSFEDERKIRKEKQKEVLSTLVSIYGDKIISRVIRDCSKKSLMIWEAIFDLSSDHERDIQLLIEIEEKSGLSYYLSRMSLSDLTSILDKYNYSKILLEAFPYNNETVLFIDGKENEVLFWRTHAVSTVNDVNFEYIYNKYIEFAPENLLVFFAYRYDYDYDHGIVLLEKIAEQGFEQQENGWGINKRDCLIEIVDGMDKKYYTKELSICEFKLLGYLMGGLRDYPMGVKRYFWDNPSELGNLIIGLYNTPDLKPESVGNQFYFDSVISISGNCFIPKEYLWQKKTELKKWVDGMLQSVAEKDDSTCRLVKNAIINTLACYPRNGNNDIWPCTEIADIIENLSKRNYDDRFSVSSELYCAYNNRRGVRSVDDGSVERALGEQFKIFSENYKYSHPVVSRALEYISDEYFREAESDNLYATTGKI